jgi:hypothetical protein
MADQRHDLIARLTTDSIDMGTYDMAMPADRDPTPTARCCDMHNVHCEPPGDLCCRDCTEVAHDTFPVRHADGTACVLVPTRVYPATSITADVARQCANLAAHGTVNDAEGTDRG